MKKIILSVILVSMSTGLFAQLSKGAFAITGIVGLNGGKNKTEQTNNVVGGTTMAFDQKNKGFTFMPAISYFVSSKLEAGILFGITKTTTTNTYYPTVPNPLSTKEIKNENPLTGFGIFGNYYLVSKEKFHWYAGLQFGVASGKGKVTTTLVNGSATIVETKNNASTFGLNTGFLYFVKSNLALNGSVGVLSFNTVKTESTAPDNNNDSITTKTNNSNWVFGLNGLAINIGVKFFLRNNVAP